MKTKHVLLLTPLLLSGMMHAATVAQWNFNAATDKLNTSTGTGTASLLVVGATFASDTANGGSSDPTPVGTTNGGGGWNLGGTTPSFPSQGNGSGTAGARFDADTSGFTSPAYTGLQISFDLRTSNTASRWYRLDYSTDGGSNWTIGTPNRMGAAANAGDTWHNGNTVAINDATTLDNTGFSFRILSVFSPVEFTEANSSTLYAANTAYEVARNTSSNYGGGTWRLDMVTVTAIPEPTAALLGGLGLLALLRRRRG